MTFALRPERPDDAAEIRRLTDAAFRDAPHGDGGEGALVDALRAASALTLSLVAEDGGALIGHVAFSPVTIAGAAGGWFGLGPVSVLPARQGEGIGGALIREGLARLKRDGGEGCVVLGDPAYYGRFGFRADGRLTLPGFPPHYFQSLCFGVEVPCGAVGYHPAFGA